MLRCDEVEAVGGDFVEAVEEVSVYVEDGAYLGWPRRAAIVLGCSPWVMRRALWLCLRSWNRHGSPIELLTAGSQWRRSGVVEAEDPPPWGVRSLRSPFPVQGFGMKIAVIAESRMVDVIANPSYTQTRLAVNEPPVTVKPRVPASWAIVFPPEFSDNSR